MRKLGILFSLLLTYQLAAQPFEIKQMRLGHVKRYETCELGLRIPNVDRLLRNFSAHVEPARNPYRTADIAVQVEFRKGNLRQILDAFYYEEPVPDDVNNVMNTEYSKWPFRVRFCPADTGTWQVSVLLGDPSGERMAMPTEIAIHCVPSTDHGWLKVNADKRRLVFEDNTPFFALGQNLAWADMAVLRGKFWKPSQYLTGYYDMDHYMQNLADNGGNYVRFVLVPWSTAIEWDEAGRYNQVRAAVLDSLVRIAEERGMYIHLCLEMHTSFQDKFDEQHSWKNNPYHKVLPAAAKPTDFLVNDSCRALYKQRLRYMLARWGHTPHVAVIEFMSELNFWDGYKGNEQRFVDWHREMARYVRNDLNDQNHLLTTCFGTFPWGELYRLDEMQLISVHPYGNNYNVLESRWLDANGRNPIKEQRGIWRRWEKPLIFGEMGMINGPVNAADAGDMEHCNDISYHTALWSSAFSGGFGAGLMWWEWGNDAHRKANFPALRWFVDSVMYKYEPYPIHAAKEYGFDRSPQLQCFYEVQNSRIAYGWLHNRSWWWQNINDSCLDRNGKKMLPPRDNDRLEDVRDYTGKTIRIAGFRTLEWYLVTYYDTRIAGKVLKQEKVKAGIDGKLELTMPVKTDCAWSAQSTFFRGLGKGRDLSDF